MLQMCVQRVSAMASSDSLQSDSSVFLDAAGSASLPRSESGLSAYFSRVFQSADRLEGEGAVVIVGKSWRDRIKTR